jgi:hypothetical protein
VSARTEPANWEVLHQKTNRDGLPVDTTERLPVPGGWIYRTTVLIGYEPIREAVAMVFVPLDEATKELEEALALKEGRV